MTTPALQNSIVKDMGLASEGHLKIDWVEAHMPVLNRIRRQFEQDLPFKGLKVAICLHLEAKTAYLAKVIQAGGAEVTITHSNPRLLKMMSARHWWKTVLPCMRSTIRNLRNSNHCNCARLR